MQNAEEFWDNTAEKYAKSQIADMDSYTYTLGRTRSYLSADDKVLEFGCGTGSTALLLAKDVLHITASDLSSNMTEIGSNKARDQGVTNIKFVTSDIYSSEFENGSYDAVLAHNLLHLLEDLPSAIVQIRNLLKPGGTFISKTPCQSEKPMPFKFRIMMAVLPLMQWVGKAPYVNIPQIKNLEEIMTSNGFKIVECGNHPAPGRYIVATKI